MTRKLRPDEKELWTQVARTADPLHPKRTRDSSEPVKEPLLAPKGRPKPKPRDPIPTFKVGQAAKTETRVPSAPKPAPKMDAKTFGKMKKGRLDPEGRIDLHGMTLDQAHPELRNFILRSHAKGRRLVLVITGKGAGPGPTGPIPYQRGILRRQVPDWLRQAPIGNLILQVTSASPKHGGDGALYVYLRRQR